MELTVQRGKGYSPAEERSKLPIGELPVDAIFSPVHKVGYQVEQARVGQMTSFDRLIMEIWTDGTVQPLEALREAASILVKHLSLVAGVEKAIPEEEVEEEGIPAHLYEMLIEDLDLSVRVYNCLKRTGITSVGEVLEKLEKGDGEMMSIRNFGPKSLNELKEKLRARGLLLIEEEESEE
jgi:DNA-directed RNA polymerase subunit alpha